jgi:catechol 2,3-dioxygenase-like lactoylglutathione lyase family enzyme
VNVHDLERAASFYKDTLGMKHLFTVPPTMAFFDCVGIRLMLAIPERPDLDHPSSILYFKVPDIELRAQSFAFARCAFRDQTDAGRADGDP